MNHAFLILAHDSPELLERIIKRLEAPNHYIFVHLDKKSDLKDFLGRGGIFLESERLYISHGGFSQVIAEILLLRIAFNYSVNFDYFHLISGHDYPCVSNDTFDRFFENVPKERSFMHFDSDEQHELWKDRISQRFTHWNLRDLQFNRFFCKPIELILNFLCPKKLEVELYAGWNWFSWHRSLVKWMLNYWDNNQVYLKKWRFSSCSDEVIFHTILYPYIDELNIDKSDSLRYIDWFPQRAYKSLPLILNEQDFQAIADSGKLLCRKVFIGESSKLLNMLDSRV